MKDAERILVFNVNWLGDVLFSTAVIRNIRYNFPDAYLACVVPSRCYAVLKDNPYLDEVIFYDDKSEQRSISAKFKFIKLLKRKRFDSVFLLHRSFTRALLCVFAGIKKRIGISNRKRAFLLTRNIPEPAKDSLHRIDYYLNIIEQVGLKIKDRFCDFSFKEEDAAFVRKVLEKNKIKSNDILVVLNPGGNWLLKRWPFDYWSKLADRLIEECRAKVVISGAHSDLKLAMQIKASMKKKAFIACGIFSLKQFAALCKQAALVVSADSGPLHIASAVGAKNIIAIFGPTHKAITGPRPDNNVFIIQKDSGCRIPCYVLNCKDNRCMKAVTPDDVMEVARRIIK